MRRCTAKTINQFWVQASNETAFKITFEVIVLHLSYICSSSSLADKLEGLTIIPVCSPGITALSCSFFMLTYRGIKRVRQRPAMIACKHNCFHLNYYDQNLRKACFCQFTRYILRRTHLKANCVTAVRQKLSIFKDRILRRLNLKANCITAAQ